MSAIDVTRGAIIDIFPVELIHRIISHLSPCEVVRLRQVSKLFHQISIDPILWRELYASARLPRPPGPFPWQSSQYLERTLVKSDLLSQNWTSYEPLVISQEVSEWNLKYASEEMLLPGQWCIWRDDDKIYYRDINTGNVQLLYHDVTSFELRHDGYFTTGVVGQRIYLMLQRRSGGPDLFLEFLEFDVNGDCLSRRTRSDLLNPDPQDSDGSGPSTSNEKQDHIYEPTPFLVVRAYNLLLSGLVFDLNTRRLYKIPRFTGDGLDVPTYHTLLPFLSDWRLSTLVVPTRTHVIAFRVVMPLGHDTLSPIPIVIQAFVAPDPPRTPGRLNLRLTHQVSFHEEDMRFVCRASDMTRPNSFYTTRNPSLLRNSVVDPVTKSINIKVLFSSRARDVSNQRLFCLDLTLPQHPSPSIRTDVLPIHARQELLLESRWQFRKHTASEDGHARGILVGPLSDYVRSVVWVRKFTLDASGEKCIAKFSASNPREIFFPGDYNLTHRGVDFDGNTGRIYYFHGKPPSLHLETMDIL